MRYVMIGPVVIADQNAAAMVGARLGPLSQVTRKRRIPHTQPPAYPQHRRQGPWPKTAHILYLKSSLASNIPIA